MWRKIQSIKLAKFGRNDLKKEMIENYFSHFVVVKSIGGGGINQYIPVLLSSETSRDRIFFNMPAWGMHKISWEGRR